MLFFFPLTGLPGKSHSGTFDHISHIWRIFPVPEETHYLSFLCRSGENMCYRSIKWWVRDAEFKVHSCEKGQQEKIIFWRLRWQWLWLFEAALFFILLPHQGYVNCGVLCAGDSGSWWWTGKPGILQSMGSQRDGHDWATEMNWCVCAQGVCVESLLENSRSMAWVWF